MFKDHAWFTWATPRPSFTPFLKDFLPCMSLDHPLVLDTALAPASRGLGEIQKPTCCFLPWELTMGIAESTEHPCTRHSRTFFPTAVSHGT
jgi:hypothetical protein